MTSEEKKELLQRAIREYPVGTRIETVFSDGNSMVVYRQLLRLPMYLQDHENSGLIVQVPDIFMQKVTGLGLYPDLPKITI